MFVYKIRTLSDVETCKNRVYEAGEFYVDGFYIDAVKPISFSKDAGSIYVRENIAHKRCITINKDAGIECEVVTFKLTEVEGK
jgi:hypothetical protein